MVNRIKSRRGQLTRALLLATALLSDAALAALPTDQTPSRAATPTAADASPQPPLRSRAQLDAWLKANAGKPTPFDALSAGGRQRFIEGLGFGERGVATLSPEELIWELNESQAHAVLALFGEESFASRIQYHPTALRWRGSKDRLSDIDQRYTHYITQGDSLRGSDELARARNLGNLYRALFPATLFQHPEKLTDPDMLILARAAARTARDTRTAGEIQDILALLPLLEQRQFDITPLARDAQVAMLGAGQLDRARAFAAEHPSLRFEPLPLVQVAPDTLPTGPRWWRLAPDARSMRAESVDLSGIQILVLAGCHYSADAATDVKTDPELAPVFASHAHWLGMPLGDEDVAAWKEWNRMFPESQMHLITRRSDWPMFPRWTMPTYAIVRDGKVIDQTTGAWRNYPEARVALVEMLRRHGLMAPASKKTASITTPTHSD
jgi:hypothetical protein